MSDSEVLGRISSYIQEGDNEGCIASTEKALASGIKPLVIVDEGLSAGIRIVGEKFGTGELFLPDLMMAVEAMREGMKIVEPELKKMKVEKKSLGNVLIGTVHGDIHDIGKSIVGTMLELNGFTVIDLGVSVAVQSFVDKIREVKPQIVGLSALLSTTMREQREVVEAVKKEGLREGVRIIVGGAPVSEQWAEEIGADGYGANAELAVHLVRKLIG
jgi:5-methyltetrahydrofolate--homocysteine methyltransferase